MSQIQNRKDILKASELIAYSGGRVIGRTKLQKIACLLSIAGFEKDFIFEYRHYGPYSEELSNSLHDASVLGLIQEEEHLTSWGNTYSIYTVSTPYSNTEDKRAELARCANAADSIILELAVTAAFLHSQGISDFWEETQARKPEKSSDGRIEKAKNLYSKLREVAPEQLPTL